MRRILKSIAFAAIGTAIGVSAVWAQQLDRRDSYPNSIMTPEPGERPARRAAPKVRRDVQPQRQVTTTPRRVRGSSSPAIPPNQSPLTPLGTAPKIGTAPSQAFPSSPAAPVPGVTARGGGPAIAPARPAGQDFQGRASSCAQASGSVGAGNVGTFTRSCVNR